MFALVGCVEAKIHLEYEVPDRTGLSSSAREFGGSQADDSREQSDAPSAKSPLHLTAVSLARVKLEARDAKTKLAQDFFARRAIPTGNSGVIGDQGRKLLVFASMGK
ncbi:hypothetical protein TWF694_010405 [Orbilia ellipsospora]|uniref:Uncharacterized protein n=1 Tax=Orbilia ellipsospora TaxID=2528407 RepID=A0AAV9X9R7_9PEZI